MGFYDEGLRFGCNGCSYCCRFEGGVVRLSVEDLQRLCAWAKLSEDQFIQVYCRYAEDALGQKFLVLKTLQNGDCLFWNKDLCDGKGGCECYEARPVQCSTYPFWTGVLKDEVSWNAEGEKCPGINNGDVCCKEKIESEKLKYENRVPIVK